MLDFDRCLAFTLQEEGGFSDNVADPGGATNHGITIAKLTAWRAALGESPATVEDVRNLSVTEATQIYAAQYWNPIRGSDLPAGLDLACFDFAVNAGPRRAAMFFQQAVGAGADGWIGPQTLAQSAKADWRTALVALLASQVQFYAALPTFPTFGKGWLLRSNRRLLAAFEMARQ